MEITILKTKMEKAVDNMSDQLRGLHSGIISSGLVDTVKVEQFGQQVPIKHVAQTADSPQGIHIHPYDKAMCGPIVTALKHAGFDAYMFSKVSVMVNRPKPSGEDKVKVQQQIAKLGEDAKVAVRQIRHNYKSELDGPEDEMRNGEKLAQSYTDSACRLVDKIVKEKCANL